LVKKDEVEPCSFVSRRGVETPIHAVNTFAPGAREYEVIADRALSELVETQAAGMPVFACCHEVQIQPPFAPSSCQGMSSL
jgi:hypothetical protein